MQGRVPSDFDYLPGWLLVYCISYVKLFLKGKRFPFLRCHQGTTKFVVASSAPFSELEAHDDDKSMCYSCDDAFMANTHFGHPEENFRCKRSDDGDSIQ